jgi:hypothetical protein
LILDGLGLTLDAPGAEITDTNTTKIVGLLVEASKLDPVYRDVYLRRGREHGA